MTPDHSTLLSHMRLAWYKRGEAQGWWSLAKIEWPYAYFILPAKRVSGEQDRFAFRFELSNYPQAAPTACPWQLDFSGALPASCWPSGTLIGAAFNPNWNQGALYLPCDRLAMAGHERWRNDHPNLWWTPEKTIVVYLNELHDLLNHRDYSGPRSG